MIKHALLVLVLILISLAGYSQQAPQFTKYMFNSLVFNPAYAGSPEYLSVRLLYRNQWYGQAIEGTPVTQSFTVHTPANERVAFGLSVVNDEIGANGSTAANFSYAYRFKFGKGKLSLGLQAGFLNWRNKWDQLKYREPRSTDSAFSDIKPNQWLPNFGAGVFYYSPLWYAGFSVPHLLNQEFKREPISTAESTPSSFAKLYRTYYFTGGAALPLNGNALIFKPSILIKSVGLFSAFAASGGSLSSVGTPTAVDVDLSLMFYETLWVGASYRTSIEEYTNTSTHDSADVWMSIYLNNGMRIGASYDYPLTKIQQFGKGSFELMLGYDFNYEVKKVNTPRYF